MRRIGPVLLGFLLAIVLIVIGGYIFIVSGGVPMVTSSAPLPLEATVAKLALRANYKASIDLKNPLPLCQGRGLRTGVPLTSAGS
jgi:hypothetical protein